MAEEDLSEQSRVEAKKVLKRVGFKARATAFRLGTEKSLRDYQNQQSGSGSSSQGGSGSASSTPPANNPPSSSGGGGNNTTTPPSSSGGGRSSGGGMDWRLTLTIIGSFFVAITTGIGALIWALTDTPKNRANTEDKYWETRKSEEATEQAKELTKQMKILAKSGKQVAMPVPPQLAPAPAPTVTPQQRREVHVPTFNCASSEDKEAGFARLQVQVLDDPNTTYRFNGGCAWVKVTTPVTDVAGDLYLFQQQVGEKYYGCGTYEVEGQLRCDKHLNSHLGESFQLIIGRGSVSIN